MSDVIIRVQSLGKTYRIKQRTRGRYTALRDVIADKAAGMLRLHKRADRSHSGKETFWALKDVSFEVNRGEVVGIIGRNGAGKSTLLKILSRITEPTTGRVELDGRIASLLEVGTGFHPELTGRENIFLNGAILGMTRSEIRLRFEEIVAFAEVEQFLEVPVKHYSSGMYVRLAFAVAAHLETEILVVDEVLAVGDAEFQKKCLGKMREASRTGRTVLFVSHNIAAVSSLTNRGIVLDAGRMAFDGSSIAAIEYYRDLTSRGDGQTALNGRGAHTSIRSVRLLNGSGDSVSDYVPASPLRLEITLQTDGTANLSVEAFLLDALRQRIALASLHHFNGITLPRKAGLFRTVLELPPMWLASGSYSFDLTTSAVNSDWDHYVERALAFDVLSCNPGGQSWEFKQGFGYGTVAMPCVYPPQFDEVSGPNVKEAESSVAGSGVAPF